MSSVFSEFIECQETAQPVKNLDDIEQNHEFTHMRGQTNRWRPELLVLEPLCKPPWGNG